MGVKDKSPLTLLLGLVVLATGSVTFGVTSMEFLENSIEPFAGWVFAVGFIGVYLISDREIGNLENYEGVALLLPIVAAVGIQTVPELNSLLSQYNPMLGIILTGVTLIGFYTVATNMELSYVVMEIILGIVLASTAAMHYGIYSVQVLDNHIGEISIWVFVVTLAGAYMISKRSLGTFSRAEIGAMILGIGTYVAFVYVPEVEQIVLANNPYSGIGLTVALGFAYYVLMNNGDVLPN